MMEELFIINICCKEESLPGPTEEERRKMNLEEVNLHTLHLSFTLSLIYVSVIYQSVNLFLSLSLSLSPLHIFMLYRQEGVYPFINIVTLC